MLAFVDLQPSGFTFGTDISVTNVPYSNYWSGLVIRQSGDKRIILYADYEIWYISTYGQSWSGSKWMPLGGANNFLLKSGAVCTGDLSVSHGGYPQIYVTDGSTCSGLMFLDVANKIYYIWNSETGIGYDRLCITPPSTVLGTSLKYQREISGAFSEYIIYGAHNVKSGTSSVPSDLVNNGIYLKYS